MSEVPNSDPQNLRAATVPLPLLEPRFLALTPKIIAQRDAARQRKEAVAIKFRLQRMFRDLDAVDEAYRRVEDERISKILHSQVEPVTQKMREHYRKKRVAGGGRHALPPLAPKPHRRKKKLQSLPQEYGV